MTGWYRDFPFGPYPHTCRTSPIINITHQNGTLFTKDEPNLIHHHRPTSIVYLRVHSRCCTFKKFRQIFNGMYSSL